MNKSRDECFLLFVFFNSFLFLFFKEFALCELVHDVENICQLR